MRFTFKAFGTSHAPGRHSVHISCTASRVVFYHHDDLHTVCRALHLMVSSQWPQEVDTTISQGGKNFGEVKWRHTAGTNIGDLWIKPIQLQIDQAERPSSGNILATQKPHPWQKKGISLQAQWKTIQKRTEGQYHLLLVSSFIPHSVCNFVVSISLSLIRPAESFWNENYST